MSATPQSDEYLAARRESCRLLGLDPSDLTTQEAIKADVVTTLRLWLDASQGQLLAGGGNVDPTKLLAISETLSKLIPERDHRKKRRHDPNDPREVMLKIWMDMHERGEVTDRLQEPSLRDRLAALESENAQLKAEVEALRAAGGPPAPSASAPSAPPAPADDGPPPAGKPPWGAPAAAPAPVSDAEREANRQRINSTPPPAGYLKGPPEPWRRFIGGNDRWEV